jgi:tight adherence protein B
VTARLHDIASKLTGGSRGDTKAKPAFPPGTGEGTASKAPEYDNYRMTRKEARNYYSAAAMLLMATGMLFYQSALFSLLLIPLCFPARKHYEAHLAAKRRKTLNDQFRDLLYSLSASFSAGRQMPEALAEGLENMRLIYPDDAPIIRELAHIKKSLYEDRAPEKDVLTDFARRSHSEDIQNFTDVYFTCRETGGDLERVVMKAAEVIADKLNIEREIRTITAQKRFEAKFLAVMPPGLILILQITSPAYLAILYETPQGRVIMTAALIMTAAACFLSVKLTEIKV